MSHLQNPFRAQQAAPARKKPALSPETKAAIQAGEKITPSHPLFSEVRDMLRSQRASGWDVAELSRKAGEMIAAQSARIDRLETALRHALAEVDEKLMGEVEGFLGDDDQTRAMDAVTKHIVENPEFHSVRGTG